MGCCCCREHSYNGKCSLWLVDTQTGEVIWRRAPWRQKWTRSGTPMAREDAISNWVIPVSGTTRFLTNRSVGSPVTDPDINWNWGTAYHEVLEMGDFPPRLIQRNDALNGSGLPSLDGGGAGAGVGSGIISPVEPHNLVFRTQIEGTPTGGGGFTSPWFWKNAPPFQSMWLSREGRFYIGTSDTDSDGEPLLGFNSFANGYAYFTLVNLGGGQTRYDYSATPNGTEPRQVGGTFWEYLPSGVRVIGSPGGTASLATHVWDVTWPVTVGSTTMNAVPASDQLIPSSYGFTGGGGPNPRTVTSAPNGTILSTVLLPWLVPLSYTSATHRTTTFGVDSIRGSSGPPYTLWSWDKASGTQAGTCSIYSTGWQDLPDGVHVYTSTSSTHFGVVHRAGGTIWSLPASSWQSADGSIHNLRDSGYTLLRPNVTNDFSPTLCRLSDGAILWSLDGAVCRAARMTPDGILMAGTLPS